MATSGPNPSANSVGGEEERAVNLATRRTGRVLRGVLSAVTAALVGTGVLFTLPAAAEPSGPSGSSSTPSAPTGGSQPSTSAQAKQAWLDASDKADAANEDLLQAKLDEKSANAAESRAKVAVARTQLAAVVAQSRSVQAAAALASYRQQLADFASASFRGARLGQLSALLTAQSSTDYLDEVSSLDQVADHTQELMAAAVKAKQDAAKASANANAAADRAQAAKIKADTAVSKAVLATQTVQKRKSTLDVEVASYHTLYNSLSAKERDEAIAEQQAAWEEQAKQQQAAWDQQVAEQQAAVRAAASSSSAAASSSSAAAAAAAKAAAAAATPTSVLATAAAKPAVAAPPVPPTTPSAASSSAPSSSKAAAPPAATSKGQAAVNAALTRLGMRYIYGAAGPTAFDCSGLTSWAWAQVGVSIPHSSYEQSLLPSVPLDQLQPGDLVTYYSPVHHVAMYIGNGQIIDASTESKPIFITDVYRGGPDPSGHRVQY